jgi:co-chaperonin GroES (HSP10)
MTKIIPLQDYVIVKKIENKEQVVKGILIPVKENNELVRAIVHAINPKPPKDCIQNFKVGDTIIIRKFGGAPITEDGINLLILKTEEIIAKVLDGDNE